MPNFPYSLGELLGTGQISSTYYEDILYPSFTPKPSASSGASSQGGAKPGGLAFAALTKDLPRKLGFMAEALSFFSGKVNGAIGAAQGGSVNISAFAGADSEQFMSAVHALGLGFSQQDGELTKQAKDKQVIVSTSTLKDWASRLDDRVKALSLLASKLDNATVDAQSALSTELQKVATDMENVPTAVPPPTGRARAFYGVLAAARTFLQFKADPDGLQYATLLKGLDKQLPATISGDERYFQMEVLGDVKRHAEIALGLNFDIDSTYKQGWEKWKQDTLTKTGLTTPGSYGALVNMLYERFKSGADPARGQAALDIAMERARSVAAQTFNFRLQKELPNLGKDLLSNSEYEAFQGRLQERARRQESGRLYASVAALWSVADEAVFAKLNTDGNSGTHWLAAAQQLASAMQVPFSFALATLEAHRDGKSVRAVVDTYLDPSKKVSGVSPVRRDSIELQSLDAGGRVQLAPANTLSEERRHSLIRAAETSRFDVRSLKDMRAEFGKNSIFLGTDILALASDINRAVVTKDMTKVQEFRLALDFLTDLSFLFADAVGVVAKGPFVGTMAKGAGAAGMAISWTSALTNIADTVERFQGKPEQAREITLSVYNFFATIVSTTATYFHPTLGVMLTMLLPNGAAISQALNLQDAYNNLMSKGRTLEAAYVKTLHTIAALDSTPIVNAFGAIYRSLLNSPDKLAAADVDPWVNGVYKQRMDSLIREMSKELWDSANKSGTQEFHIVTSMKQQIEYSELATPGHVNSGLSRRTFSSWVDFGLRRDTTTGNMWEPNPTNWQSDDFSVIESTAWTTVDGKRVPLNFIKKKNNIDATLTQQTAGEWGAVKDIKKAFYLIEKGNADQPATLLLNHATSTIDTTYQVNDMANLRIRAGSGDDVFQLGVTPLEIDGGGGINVAGYSLATEGVTIDMSKGKNINMWVGSKFTNQVKGTSGGDTYRSASASVADVVSLGDGDDLAVVGEASTVNMGAGDDVTFFLGTPADADGGSGTDIATYQQMKSGVTFANMGNLRNYEAFVGTEYADWVGISSGSIKSWNLGGGNDYVELDDVSNVTVLLGSGDNRLISTSKTANKNRNPAQAYDNVLIAGGDGVDKIDVRLFNSHTFSISGADGNDQISVEAAAASSSNRVEIIGGVGDDSIKLKGNIEAMLRFRASEGTDEIFDDAERESALTLIFDSKLTQKDIKTSVIKDGVTKDAAGNTYAYIVEVTGGNTKARLHTYTVPAEIRVQTTEDRNVSTINLASLWQGSSANAGMQRRASLLIDSMASFGDMPGASSGPSLLVREAPGVMLAAAA